MNKEEIQKAIDEFVNSYKQRLAEIAESNRKFLDEMKKKFSEGPKVDLSQFTTREYFDNLWKK